jgi:hypothetical protein
VKTYQNANGYGLFLAAKSGGHVVKCLHQHPVKVSMPDFVCAGITRPDGSSHVLNLGGCTPTDVLKTHPGDEWVDLPTFLKRFR